jgi:general secretion pathway protein M
MIEWFHNLALRERQFVSIGAVFVLLSLVYLFVFEPLANGLEESRIYLDQKQSDWEKLENISNEYKRLGATKNTFVAKDNRSLLAVIDQSGSKVGIKSSIKRLTPEGENKVRVRVEDVAFDSLLEWLVANSTKHSIHAELFIARKTDGKGKVNATLLFEKD